MRRRHEKNWSVSLGESSSAASYSIAIRYVTQRTLFTPPTFATEEATPYDFMHISKGSRVSPHYILYSNNNNNYDQYHVYVTLEDGGKIGGVSVEQRYKIANDLYLFRCLLL